MSKENFREEMLVKRKRREGLFAGVKDESDLQRIVDDIVNYSSLK